jgi:pseudaminic acid biosynthesis-associated methylase
MNHTVKPLEEWAAAFGQEYTDRNPFTAQEMDRFMEQYCGARSSDLFMEFFPPSLLPSGRVLEVGCNVGAQLRILNGVNSGLDLYGVEPMPYALRKAREGDTSTTFVPGTAFDLPFKDGFFDLIMTNTVLIHIAPQDLPQAMREICRCSRRFIFGHEYFAESPTEITYRGRRSLLWKTNFAEQYQRVCADLKLARVRYLRYTDPDAPGSELIDQVFLLEKTS